MLNNNKKENKQNKLTHSFIQTHTSKIMCVEQKQRGSSIAPSMCMVSNLSNAKAAPIKKPNHTHTYTHAFMHWRDRGDGKTANQKLDKIGWEYGIQKKRNEIKRNRTKKMVNIKAEVEAK